MIVDDDRTTTSLLSTLLELDGFDVVLAADAGAGVTKAGVESPDVFIVDYHLADSTGIEFIQQIRRIERFSKTPIVMSSGLSRDREAKEAGANAFLLKPFDPSDLVALLNKLLGI